MRAIRKRILEMLPLPLYEYIRKIVHKLRFMKNSIIGYRATKIPGAELYFFKAIFKDIKILVDVGARYDTDFLDISMENGIQYYLFEVNPKFYKRLKRNLLKFNNEKVIVENIAVGEKDGFCDYFEDSQSLLINTTAIKNSTMKVPNLRMTRLDSYFNARDFKSIDFLKTDIEEYDYFALLGAGNLLKNCKFVQFELGIGAPIDNRIVKNDDYFVLFNEGFKLFILNDENNSYLKKYDSDLISLNNDTKKMIIEAQNIGVGFNIVAVNNSINLNSYNLKIHE